MAGCRYAALLSQGHNRVYFEASKKLSAAELEVAARAFSVKCTDVEVKEIEGVYYAVFETEERLKSEDLRVLSRLSFVYALFEAEGGDCVTLRPVRKGAVPYFGDDLSMILKYTGKTNEIFTRLLINTAVFAGGYGETERLNLLDPAAGKGTTLFEGLTLGYNCYGIEIGSDAVRDSVVFMKKYLETGRYKHSFKRSKLSGENKSFTAEINEFEIAKNKEDAKNGNTVSACFIDGDSRFADKYFKKEFFHVIAGDLPYGVQHGNVTRQKQSSLTRNPEELLRACLPGWVKCLKRGGTAAFSWNTFVLSRADMEDILGKHGLYIMSQPPFDRFSHRVDQAINRDIIVAKK